MTSGSPDGDCVKFRIKSQEKKLPRVTVISQYYNRRDVLERTIRSVLAQSFEDFELVVIDDASTDGTAAELKRLQELFGDPRFTFLIHDENVGITEGLRRAILRSQSEFVAIQGSGDIAYTDRLQRQVELLDSDADLGAVGCWYRNIDERTGNTTIKRSTEQSARSGAFSHGEMMVRRQAYDRAGGYRSVFYFAQLTDLQYRIAEFAHFANVPEILYDRYLRADGVTLNPRRTIEQAQFLRLAAVLRTLPPERERETIDRVEAGGVGTVVPESDPSVQRRIMRVLLLMCLYDQRDDANSLISRLASAGDRRRATWVVRLSGLPLGARGARGALAVRRRVRRATRRL